MQNRLRGYMSKWGREQLHLFVHPSGGWIHTACNSAAAHSGGYVDVFCVYVSMPPKQKEMHKFCSQPHDSLQRPLRKCQGHLCCSKRVWNEDGEYVTLRWEVITGSSKAAHHVSFTGHSLVASRVSYSHCLCDILTLRNESWSAWCENEFCVSAARPGSGG